MYALRLATVWASLNIAAATIHPQGNLFVTNKRISPDGYERVATLAGETEDGAIFPGPPILAQKGDRFRLNVINELSDYSLERSTSIHWHGIFQRNGSNWADGTAWVTQCPIAPGDSFLYEFSAPSQAGTFWYHSHLATQYCDGLRGPLIVYDPEDPYRSEYDYDDETTIITLSDWFHQTYTGGIPPSPDSVLINGRGRYPSGPQTPLTIIGVKHGKRYRFRIISTACEPSFNFSIDNHTMTIIEADGEYTERLLVDNIQIHAGQRYSVILTANQPVDNYWIRANPDARGKPGFDNNRNLAILRYESAPEVDPNTTSIANHPLNEAELHGLVPAPGLPWEGGADLALNFVIQLDINIPQYTLNGVRFVPPNAPVLLQILSGTQNAQDLLPKGNVYELPRNKVIEITFPGISDPGSPHPFHLHGHAFSVVRSAGSQTYNYLNPVRRDTVSIGTEGDNVTVRFETDNPGPWFLHCHMNFHLDLGLAVILAEAIPDIKKNIRPPSFWNELCPEYYQSNHTNTY